MKKALIILLIILLAVSATGCDSIARLYGAKSPAAVQIVNRLKEKGLPVANIVAYTEASDPYGLLGKPNQYVSKANFSDPDHEDDPDSPANSVEVFASAADAKARAETANNVTCSVCITAKYIYQHDVHVLLLHPDITLENAAKYEAAFLSAVS